MKPYYLVCVENVQHGIAFFLTKEVPFTNERNIVGKRVQKRRFRQGVILKRPPVSVKSVILSHAEDTLLA